MVCYRVGMTVHARVLSMTRAPASSLSVRSSFVLRH